MGSAGELRSEQRFDLARLGESPDHLFREEHPPVEADDEIPPFALDQTDLLTGLCFDFGRQTGGTGSVVSNDAVFDGDARRIRHVRLLESGLQVASLAANSVIASLAVRRPQMAPA